MERDLAIQQPAVKDSVSHLNVISALEGTLSDLLFFKKH